VTLDYLGALPASSYISIVDAAGNSNDPCVLGTVAAATLSDSSSGALTADANNAFTLSYAVLSQLDATKTYAACYAQNTGAAAVADEVWADSYLRFTLSKIDTVTTHTVEHKTQGHLAVTDKLDMTYQGTLAAGSYVALVDEDQNSGAPCAQALHSTPSNVNAYSGAKQASTGTKTAQFDTTTLNHLKNYALCYTDSADTAATWGDSGIPFSIARVSKLTYNEEQEGTTATGVYLRDMPSTNAAPASDSFPLATNVVPQKAGSIYTYFANAVADGSGVASINDLESVAYVSATLNSNNPCVDPSNFITASSSSSGALQPATGKTFTVPQSAAYLGDGGEYMMAVCYTAAALDVARAGTLTDSTWRDSYIRLKVSQISSIQSYGIQHITTGMVASKSALTLQTFGGNAASSNWKVALVHDTLNANQPCVAAEAGRSAATTPADALREVSNSTLVLAH
jgi:hypothetical protein